MCETHPSAKRGRLSGASKSWRRPKGLKLGRRRPLDQRNVLKNGLIDFE